MNNKLNPDFINSPKPHSYYRTFFRNILGLKLIYSLKKLFKAGCPLYTNAVKDKEIIFIHIPKAAGTSFSKELYGARQGHHLWSSYAKIEPRLYSQYKKISIVRNPYERLYSAYFYLKNSPHLEDRVFFENELSHYKNFDEFVCLWLTKDNVKTWKHFYPQADFIFNDKGDLMIDFLGFTENIDNDTARLNALLGLNLKVKSENKNAAKPALKLKEEIREKIFKVYERDFKLLGYKK